MNLCFRKDESGAPVWKDTNVYAMLNGGGKEAAAAGPSVQGKTE